MSNGGDDGDEEIDVYNDGDEEESIITWLSIEGHLIISSLIRLLLIVYSWIHDELFNLKYTDIDYSVFTDGSLYVKDGRSPYLRFGYRYSPLLAFLMLPNVYLFNGFGKILFAAMDVLTGFLIYKILVHPKMGCINKGKNKGHQALLSSLLWFYNPIPMIISTRGSSDTLLTFLILLTCYLLVCDKLFTAGLVYGLTIHCKIYPIIYCLPIYLYLSGASRSLFTVKVISPFQYKKLTFFLAAVASFTILTYGSYLKYDRYYLQEAWLYHIKRHDVSHNFSPYFYIYQIVKDKELIKLVAIGAFIPQILAILYYSFRYGISSNEKERAVKLMFTLFATTFLFVSLNKVVTSQYFIWYLCYLPLIFPFLQLSGKQCFTLFAVWCLGQAQWLMVAYLYQYQGWDVLQLLACCSFVFLIVNLVIQSVIEKNFVPQIDEKSH